MIIKTLNTLLGVAETTQGGLSVISGETKGWSGASCVSASATSSVCAATRTQIHTPTVHYQ